MKLKLSIESILDCGSWVDHIKSFKSLEIPKSLRLTSLFNVKLNVYQGKDGFLWKKRKYKRRELPFLRLAKVESLCFCQNVGAFSSIQY